MLAAVDSSSVDKLTVLGQQQQQRRRRRQLINYSAAAVESGAGKFSIRQHRPSQRKFKQAALFDRQQSVVHLHHRSAGTLLSACRLYDMLTIIVIIIVIFVLHLFQAEHRCTVLKQEAQLPQR